MGGSRHSAGAGGNSHLIAAALISPRTLSAPGPPGKMSFQSRFNARSELLDAALFPTCAERRNRLAPGLHCGSATNTNRTNQIVFMAPRACCSHLRRVISLQKPPRKPSIGLFALKNL